MAAKSAGRIASGRMGAGAGRKPKSPWVRRTKLILVWGFITVAIPSLILGGMFYRELVWAEGMLPKLDQYSEKLAATPSVIVSADGKVLFRAQGEYRKPVKYEDIPKNVINATLAAEDIRFYDHSGVDFKGLARAAFVNAREGRTAQGGSTITMQLAKNVYTGSERSFNRKLKDMALAVQIEKHRTKDQILTMYLNQSYYGSGAYGIGAAANVYFGKSLQQLTLAECAMLARIVQRPSVDNPFKDLDRAVENRDAVLARMLDAGMIKQSEYDKALNEKPRLARRSFGSGARTLRSPYFVDYVLDTIKREHPEIDLTTGGYRIETTLDTRLDDIAQEQVKEIVEKNRRMKITTAAFVLMDAEGRVLAMIGGVDHERNSYNACFQGGRQPGSSFKPFVYATALTTGTIGPNDRIPNEPIMLDDPIHGSKRWPKNSNNKYGGTLSIGSAIAGSVNCCAARVCQMVGPDRVVSYAHDVFGFKSNLDPVLSIALGSSSVTLLEMAQGYGVFLLGGDRATPYGIRSITGPDGAVIERNEPVIQRGVLDPQVAGWMDGFLRGVVTGGTAGRAKVVADARGKTGTTSEHKDAWFCGYSNSMVGIGWVANERKEGNTWVYDPMNRVFGGTYTIQIWTGVMREAVKLYADEERIASGRKPTPKPSVEPSTDIPVDDAAGGDGPIIISPPTPPDIQIPPTGDTGAETTGGDTTLPDTNPSNIPTSKPGPGKSNPSKPPTDANEIVTVDICAESGQLATAYCPETVTRSFAKGRAPRKRCQLHGP